MCDVHGIILAFDQAMVFVSAVLGSTTVMPPMNSTLAGSYPLSGSVRNPAMVGSCPCLYSKIDPPEISVADSPLFGSPPMNNDSLIPVNPFTMRWPARFTLPALIVRAPLSSSHSKMFDRNSGAGSPCGPGGPAGPRGQLHCDGSLSSFIFISSDSSNSGAGAGPLSGAGAGAISEDGGPCKLIRLRRKPLVVGWACSTLTELEAPDTDCDTRAAGFMAKS